MMDLSADIFWRAAASLSARAVPAHLMAYYPFRDRLRFPLWKVLLSVCLLQAGQSLLYGFALSAGRSGKAMEYGFAAVYMAVYFFYVRDDRCKLLFLYLFVMDYVMILRGFSSFLEARLFYRPDMDFASWGNTLAALVSLAVSAPFMLHFFARARERVFRTDAPAFWRTAWLAPAFTTAIVMAFTGSLAPEQVRSFRFLFARVLLLLCVFVVYSLLLDGLDGIRRQAVLAEQAAAQERLLSVQKLQYTQLVRHMEEVRTTRHDLRQHLSVIRACAGSGETEKLLEYLNAYESRLPADIRKTFCANFAANAVFTYYAEEARKNEIDFDVDCPLPERLPVQEPEVCALLGNLLENAVDACREMTEAAPFIRVCGECRGHMVVLTVDNTCLCKPAQENGRFLSTRHDGYGTGTSSVKATAEKNGGSAKFEYKDGIFYASVLLYGSGS